MPSVRGSISVPANTAYDDVLIQNAVREQARRCTEDGMVTVALTQSATGLICDVTVGSELEAPSVSPIIKATAPVIPDEVLGSFAGLRGELVSLSCRNTTAGALTLFYALDVP